MKWIDRLTYTFSSLHFDEVWHRCQHLIRYEVINRKRIDLAVVGTASSGKSFLLNDILSSLRNMGGTFSSLRSDSFLYKTIVNYSPDESGGHGQTPIYACRSSNFYGTYVNHAQDGRKYDFVFMNIPGEIFMMPNQGKASRLRAYISMEDALSKMKKNFYVSTWVDAANEIRYIVEPVSGSSITDDIRHSHVTTDHQILKTRYMEWSEIFGDLNNCGFHECKGSKRKISGTTLLKKFFEYDTDSVMMTFQDMIKNGLIKCDFDKEDFKANDYDKCFTFFHYCSRASDIVLCDRLFTMKETATNEMPFGEITKGISSFLNNLGHDRHVNVYLSFRNVDYLMYSREKNYQKLNKDILGRMDKEQRRNIIYSLFHYILQHHINKNVTVKGDDFYSLIGLPKEGLPENDIITENVDRLTENLVDLSGNQGVVYEAPDLENHITTRLGDEAHAFNGLLRSSDNTTEAEEELFKQITPHIYFTCTPITQDYAIFQNYQEGDLIATDFCKEVNGKTLFFTRQNSHACFGSYQLCMDILTQHDLMDAETGTLLRRLQNNL